MLLINWEIRLTFTYLRTAMPKRSNAFQARAFNLTRDPIGEKRMIEPAFGVGPCVMSKTMARLEQQRAA